MARRRVTREEQLRDLMRKARQRLGEDTTEDDVVRDALHWMWWQQEMDAHMRGVKWH